MSFRWAAVCAATLMPVAALAQSPTAPGGQMPQGQQEMMKTMHLAARNQLGIIEYCQSQGSVGADVVALQKRMLGMLPPAQVDGLDAAEDAGKKGMVQFAGNSVDIKDAAKAQNTTPDAMCKQIGSMLQAQASNLPK